jgi:transcriptional regulator of met regulon
MAAAVALVVPTLVPLMVLLVVLEEEMEREVQTIQHQVEQETLQLHILHHKEMLEEGQPELIVLLMVLVVEVEQDL